MKTFLKIVAGLVGLVILIGIGLNLYFTDDRLKSTVMPHLNDALGREAEVQSMSLTFFKTFPRPGIGIDKFMMPGETKTDSLLTIEQLLVSVDLFSLLGDQINISELTLHQPNFTYEIFSDGSTNIDFLTQADEQADATEDYNINIPNFRITGGEFGYRDKTSGTEVLLQDLNADISLQYADLITSAIDLKLGELSASVNDTAYITNLPLSLQQQSVIDLNKETISIREGTFTIRGLALNLTGTLSNWSNTLMTDLTYSSSSDNFGDLLRLIPQKYEKEFEGLETEGNLTIDGSLNGALGGEDYPDFDLAIQVNDGYLKNPDLPEPIREIRLDATANNKSVTISTFTAQAGENNFSASGKMSDPLESNGTFNLKMDGEIDLATVNQFWDINEYDLEQLGGQLTIAGDASGQRSKPEDSAFDFLVQLNNGILKYSEAPQQIENITVDARATDKAINLKNVQFQAADNSFTMRGLINNPLNETQRTVDLTSNLEFDLASVKEFYPIDEDTLSMRGMLTANVTLQGAADQLERAIQTGNVSLRNGFISHQSLGKPIENLTLESTLSGPSLNISNASFTTGQNKLAASGLVKDYLSDNPMIDLKLSGDASFDQLDDYYDMEPTLTSLTGYADINLRTTGPIKSPADMNFDGSLSVRDVNMEGEGLVQPVRNLEGELNLSPQQARLNSLSLKLGSSDITLNGSLANYREYLKEETDRDVIPHLQGSYKSNLLNLDELINWDDTTSTPIPIHLPHLTSTVEAEVSELIITDVRMKNLKAQAKTNPNQINLEQATINLFNGEAAGSFIWDVPDPESTHIAFKGSLDSLQVESFFETYPILGEQSQFHEYVTGAFSAKVNYSSNLDEYLKPVMQTSQMNGTFSMTNSRLQDHPVQKSLTSQLKADEFNNIGLDEWQSTYTLEDNIFTIKSLRLTSDDIGLELNGTQHIVKGTIDYQMQLRLPGRFKGTIASVISAQAANALMQEDETIMIPFRVKGTNEDPKVSPDKEVITPIIQEYLKTKGKNLLKNIFNGN